MTVGGKLVCNRGECWCDEFLVLVPGPGVVRVQCIACESVYRVMMAEGR